MADLTINTKVKEPQEITASDNLTIEKKGSVTVSFKGTYDSETMTEYAVYSSANGNAENTFVLNGSISITDKTGDPAGVTSPHKISGLMVEQKATSGGLVYTANIQTDNASTIKVTRTSDSQKTLNVYGIIATFKKEASPAELVFTSEQFLDAITVSATNTNKEGSGTINAYGIRGNHNITFNGDIAAAISCTSTSSSDGDISATGVCASNILTISGDITKSITSKVESKNKNAGKATAYGIKGSRITIEGELAGVVKVTANSKAGNAFAYGFHSSNENISFAGGIVKDISVTAKSNNNRATAIGIYTQQAGAFTIGTGDDEADLAGNITVKATGANNKETVNNTEVCGIKTAGEITIYGNIMKNITATAENKNKESGTATACGINSDKEITINGILSGTVKATATVKADAGNAYGISGLTVNIGKGVAKDITATATVGTKGDAFAIYSTSTEAVTGITIGSTKDKKGNENAIAGNLTAKITGSGTEDITASAIASTNTAIMIDGNITKTISATAENKGKESGTATACGINGGNSITINGTLSGAVKATATSKMNAATACGFFSITGISLNKGISKDITATATGKANKDTPTWGISIFASGVYSNGAVTITGVEDKKKKVNAITGNISVKGTANSYLKGDGSVGAGNSSASGICVVGKGNNLTIVGDITKNITVTATANGVKDASKTLVSGSASAWGIYVEGGDVEFNGDITGKITATATSKTNGVHSYGINSGNANTCTFSGKGTEHSFGTIKLTSSGNGDNDTASGISCDKLVFDGTLTGSITATCKMGDAFGIYIGTVATLTKDAEQAITSNITMTAKNAYAVYLKNTTSSTENVLTFEGSKLTAKTSNKTAGRAYAIYEENRSSGIARNVELIDSTLTGDVKFNSGASSLKISSSKITGDVDMGDGIDTIQISSGSQIKGDVSNVELFDMTYSGVSNNLAMWEGEDFDESAKLQLNCQSIDFASIKAGKSTKIVLMKDKDNTSVEWTTETTKIDLYLDGDKVQDLLIYNGTSVESGDFSFKLEGIEKGKTTTMQLTVTRLA